MLADAGHEIEDKIIEPVYEIIADFKEKDPLDFDIIVGVILIIIIASACCVCCYITHR